MRKSVVRDNFGLRPASLALALVLGWADPNLASAAGTDKADSARILEKGVTQFRSGDLQGAHFLLKKAVILDPANSEARVELARAEYHLGEYLAAEKQLIRALEEKPDLEAQASPLLAAVLLAEGKFKAALEIRPCIADRVCRAEVLALRARAKLALGEGRGAESDAEAAFSLMPDTAYTRVSMALVAWMLRNDPAKALSELDFILAKAPEAEALTVRGEILLAGGDAEGAINAFRSSLKVRPYDMNTRVMLITTLFAAGRDAEADQDIDKMLAEAPQAAGDVDLVSKDSEEAMNRAVAVAPKAIMGRYLKAMSLARADKMAEAIDMVRPVEFLLRDILPKSNYLLALIHLANGNGEQALKYAAHFKKFFPNNLMAFELLANIYGKAGNYRKVIETIEPVRARLQESPALLKLLASAYLAEGDFAQANDAYADAIRAQPDDPMAMAGQAVSKIGRKPSREAGFRDLEGIVKANPKLAMLDITLIGSYFAEGEFQRAVGAATAMAERQPASPVPLALRALALIQLGDDPGAARDLESALAKAPTFIPAALLLSERDMAQGNPAGARKRLDGVLALQPANFPILMARARIDIREGQPDAALPFLKTAIENHPNALEARAAMMRVFLARGDTAKVLRSAADLVAADPGNIQNVDMAAAIAIRLGQVEDGLGYYRKLMVTRPNQVDLAFRFGQVLASLGRLQEADTVLNRAVADDPGHVRSWIALANVEFRLKGEQAALYIVRKAVAHNERDPALPLLEADVKRWGGHLAEAEAAYRDAHDKTPSTITLSRLFYALLEKGDRDGAYQLMGNWLKGSPGDLTARQTLGNEAFRRGDMKTAVEQFSYIAEHNPNDVGGLNNLAWAFHQTGDSRALETARKAYIRTPDRPDVADTFAYLLYWHGDRIKGAELMRQTHRANPDHPEIGFHQAQILVDTGQRTEALSILRPIVESGRAFPEANAARDLYEKIRTGT